MVECGSELKSSMFCQCVRSLAVTLLVLLGFRTTASGEIEVPKPDDLFERLGFVRELDFGQTGDDSMGDFAISKDGRRLAAIRNQGRIEVYSFPKLTKLKELPPVADAIGRIALTPDGRAALVLGYREKNVPPGRNNFGMVSRVDLETGETSWRRDGFSWSTDAMDLAPDGSLVAIGGADDVRDPEAFPFVSTGRVRLIDAQTGEQKHELLTGLRSAVTAVRFSSRGDRLAVGHSEDASLSVWRLKDSRESVLYREDRFHGGESGGFIIDIRFLDKDRRLVAIGWTHSDVPGPPCTDGYGSFLATWDVPHRRPVSFHSPGSELLSGMAVNARLGIVVVTGGCTGSSHNPGHVFEESFSFWRSPPTTFAGRYRLPYHVGAQFSPDGRLLATLESEMASAGSRGRQRLRLWKLKDDLKYRWGEQYRGEWKPLFRLKEKP